MKASGSTEFAFVLLMLCGCSDDKVIAVEDPFLMETAGTGENRPVSTGDGDRFPEVDSNTDADSEMLNDSDTYGHDDTSETVFQSPVTLEIGNGTSSLLYLDNLFGIPRSENGEPPVQMSVSDGGETHLYEISPPLCMALCDEVDGSSDQCCFDCGTPPTVELVSPGKSLSIVWDGMLGSRNSDYCGECTCYQRVNPRPLPSQIRVCTHDSVSCLEAGCLMPTETGSHTGISVDGEPTCFTLDIEIPYTSERFYFQIPDDSEPTATLSSARTKAL